MTGPALGGLTVGVLVSEDVDDAARSVQRALEAHGAAALLLTGGVCADISELDALVIVGDAGRPPVGAWARRLAEYFVSNDLPVAAAGYGSALVIESGVATGRTLAAPPGLQGAIEEAGARVSTEPLVRDEMLVTSRQAADTDAFVSALVDLLASRSPVLDAAVADTFPASDPPATGGGPGLGRVGEAPDPRP